MQIPKLISIFAICTGHRVLCWIPARINNKPSPKFIELECILKLKIKRNDWLLAGTCPQAANHRLYFGFGNSLKFYNPQTWSLSWIFMLLGLVSVIGTPVGEFSCISASNQSVLFMNMGELLFISSIIMVTLVVRVVLPYWGSVPFISYACKQNVSLNV